MMLCRYTLLLFVVVGLSGCQSGFQVNAGDAHFEGLSPRTFVLHKDIRVSPGQAHAVFQAGGHAGGAGEYAPHCELEVRPVREAAQYIRAGVFEIRGVRGFTHYVKQTASRIQLASADGFQLVSDDGGEWIMLAYHFTLHADDQPDVMRLICGGAYNYPFYARYPTVEDMQQSLGDAASLALP
jgi:hypothetical protein